MRAIDRPRSQPQPSGGHAKRLCARLLFVVALAISGGACKRGATTACRQDVDCPAGFDCVGGSCVRRQRMRFGVDAPPVSAGPVPTAPDAGQPTDVETAPATPPPAAAPPSSPAPARPDPPRLPMWKERLKNT